jgi:hypothetical protein
MGEIAYVGDDQIRQAAEDLKKAVVEVKGEFELRYAPKDDIYHMAGKDIRNYSPPPAAYAYDPVTYRVYGTAEDWAKLDAEYSWIPDTFVRRIGPDPRQLGALANPLRSVASKLFFQSDARPGQVPQRATEPILEFVDKAKTALTGWTGWAAEQFKTNYVAPLPGTAQAQAYLAIALAMAVEGNRDMFLALRKDLHEIATKGTAAVLKVPNCELPFLSDETKAKLAIVGAVATIAAGIATIPVGGGAVLLPAGVAAFTIIAGTSSTLAAPGIGGTKDTPLDADTVDGVLGKIVDAIIDVGNTVTTKEDEMIKALQETLNVVDGSAATSYMPRRPEVLGYDDTRLQTETGFG